MSKVIPSTYVPARNTVFTAVALSVAEQHNAEAIFTGVNAMDYSGYVDCRPEYVRKWQELINLATKKTVEGGKIELITPILQLYKAEIAEWGTELGVPYELTWSCYNGRELSCGVCDSCKLRLKGFREAGLRDPLPYETDANR
jgi:7-cyano-7-deazaguanine synthase